MTSFAKNNRLRCPSCRRKRLETFDHQGTEIDVCIKCGGLWFDHTELNRCIGSFDETFKQSNDSLPSSAGINVGTTEIICPHCYKKFERIQYSKELSLTYDLCASCHGIWLEKEQFELVKHAPATMKGLNEINQDLTFKGKVFQFFTGLPLEFNITPQKKPIITNLLIFLNIFFFIASLALGLKSVVHEYGLIPAKLSATDFVTSMFLHAGVLHIAGNMYFLYKLGDNLEEALGHKKYLLFYITTGLVGALSYVLFNLSSTAPGIGASGAVSGVMGGYLVLFRKAKLTFMFLIFQFKISAYVWLGFWLFFNIMGSVFDIGNVAWLAHIGGFTSGALWTWFSYKKIVEKQPLLRLLNHLVK